MKPGATKSIYDKFVIYRFKDYLFIWAWNDGYPLWLYFLPSPFSFFSWSFCTASTQHNTNVMQITRRAGALHKIAIIREGRSTFKTPIHIYFYWIPRLSISTRAYFKYACFKTLGRLKWWPCFGRAVNDRHGFFQVRRPRSPIYTVCLSFSQRIFDFQIG